MSSQSSRNTSTPPNSPDVEVEPVRRSRDDARRNYDRIARYYDCAATPFEAAHRRCMVEMLDVAPGESVLDVGFGTGDVIYQLACAVGDTGQVAGVDLSANMNAVTTNKLDDAGLTDRADLRIGDAASMPFVDDRFDAVCASFTLELFDIDEIQTVLGECHRVLRDDGRLAIASLSRHRRTAMSRVYEALRRLFPAALDCRPIPLEPLLEARYFDVCRSYHTSMAGIPVAVVLARPRP